MKAQVMKLAHQYAKKMIGFAGSYTQRLSLALTKAWAEMKNPVKVVDLQTLKNWMMADKWSENSVYNIAFEYVNEAGSKAMMEGNSFIDSVCEQFLKGRKLSEKQAYWLAKYIVG